MQQEPHNGTDPSGAIEPSKPTGLEKFDPKRLPPARLKSAAPSKPVRALAFASIVIGGACGALIGFAISDLECQGDCSTWTGIGAVSGGAAGAIGVGIVAVLVIRAMGEWETIKDRSPEDHPSRKRDPS